MNSRYRLFVLLSCVLILMASSVHNLIYSLYSLSLEEYSITYGNRGIISCSTQTHYSVFLFCCYYYYFCTQFMPVIQRHFGLLVKERKNTNCRSHIFSLSRSHTFSSQMSENSFSFESELTSFMLNVEHRFIIVLYSGQAMIWYVVVSSTNISAKQRLSKPNKHI